MLGSASGIFFANNSQRGFRAANIRTRKLENPGFRPRSCQLSCTATKLHKRDSRIVVLKKNLRRNRVNLYNFAEKGSTILAFGISKGRIFTDINGSNHDDDVRI